MDLPEPPAPLGPSSPFRRVSSSSMVMSTRPFPSSPPSPAPSAFPMAVCCCRCSGWVLVASTWRTGWSSCPASPPQPLPVSYFLSLRDSCFFFSEAAAFTLEGSAGGAGPCGRRRDRGRGGRGEKRGGESLQEERSVRQKGGGCGGERGEKMELQLDGWSCVKRREKHI